MHDKQPLTGFIMWLIIITSMPTLSFGQFYWKKSLAYSSAISDIQPKSNGNFLIVGSVHDSTFLAEITTYGDNVWMKTFPNHGGGTDALNAIYPIDNNCFLIAGKAQSDGWLFKINAAGEVIWTKYINAGIMTHLIAIQSTTDGNFLLADITGRLIKVTPDGEVIWKKNYLSTYGGGLNALQSLHDGNFLIAGLASHSTGYSGWLAKVNANGDTLWTKTIGAGSWFRSIVPAKNNTFLIAGKTTYLGRDKGYLVKTDANGDTIWSKKFGGEGYDEFYAVQPAEDGNFLITGTIQPQPLVPEGWLLKVNSDGSKIWETTLKHPCDNYLWKVQPTVDGNYLVIDNVTTCQTGNSGYVGQIFCLIADQYACKDSPFTFKILSHKTDSLDLGYIPLTIPSGMTVSSGGMVQWTPRTDSVYMEHVRFVILDDNGGKDTLSFNIHVNSACHQTAVVSSRQNVSSPSRSAISMLSLNGRLSLSQPSSALSFSIYDLTGKRVERITPTVSGSISRVIWSGTAGSRIPAGYYFAKVSTKEKYEKCQKIIGECK